MDSTANYNNGTEAGNPTYRQAGKISYCIDYDGTGDYFSILDPIDGLAEATIEQWYNFDVMWTGNNLEPISGNWGTAGQRTLLTYFYNVSKNITVDFRDSAPASKLAHFDAGTHRNNSWFYLAGTYENGDYVYAYDNTTKYTGAACVNNLQATTKAYTIGWDGVSSQFDGTIDEFRLSKIARSDAWLKASFHTSNQTNTFLTMGANVSTAAGEAENVWRPDIAPEEITFEGYFHSTTTLQVNYSDALTSTTDAQVYIYEINTTTKATSAFGQHLTVGENEFTFNATNCNTGNEYFAIIYVNHSSFGWFVMQLWFEAPARTTVTSNKDWLFNANYGGNPFGWSNLFMWLFLTACFFSFGQRGSGIALTVTGGMTIFINSFIGFNTVLSTAAGGFLPVLFIAIGIMTMWINAGRDK